MTNMYAQYMAEFHRLLREMEANLQERSFYMACELMADMVKKAGKLEMRAPVIACQTCGDVSEGKFCSYSCGADGGK